MDYYNHSRLLNSPSPPNTLDKLITQQNVNVHNIAGSYGSYGNLSILDILNIVIFFLFIFNSKFHYV